MRVCSIEHVQLAMPFGGEDRGRRFYAGVLGLSERAKPPHLQARGGLWFEHEGLKVHLGVDPDFRPAQKAHPAFLVEGLNELIRRCRSQGYSVMEAGPVEGYERAYVDDPFGNRIELMERDVRT